MRLYALKLFLFLFLLLKLFLFSLFLLYLARAYTFIFMLILIFVGDSLDYRKELLVFIRPLQATIVLSLYFAESLSFMRLCLCALRF